MTDTFGSFQLVGIGKLPNVTVAYPGEHWSDGRASEVLIPGQLVVPGAAGGVTPSFHQLNTPKVWSIADVGAVDPRACVALRTVQVPDINPGSEYNPQLTPNDIMNLPIAVGAYVHTYRAGAFHLTLIKPDDSYAPGDLIAWDPSETAASGKPAGSGAWLKTSTAADAFFEVEEWRPLASDDTIGVLTVKSLRVQD